MKYRLGACAFVAAIIAIPAAAQGHREKGGKVLMLPRELEMRLAVDALPPSLRDGAAILVLEPTGYVQARKGANPFTCIVSRRGGNFYPVCFDEEGTRTILQAFADDAILRLKGASDAEVERKIADGFEAGRYRPPSRPGIAYMLSPATYMLNGGKLARTMPHTMFYAPYLTDADIGGMKQVSAGQEFNSTGYYFAGGSPRISIASPAP
jgi:hypothetical protein